MTVDRVTSRFARGFTVVELIVVIGLIVLLTGLTLSVGTRLIEQSEIRTTENILRLLDTAVLEWEAQAGRKLTWGIDGQPAGAAYDLQGSLDPGDPATTDVMIITEILAPVRRVPTCKSILAQIDPDYVYEYGANESYAEWIDTPEERDQLENRFVGELTVLDAWSTPIYATHPGALASAGSHGPNVVVDADGTVRTYNERVYGVTASRRVCFVSAGPDRDFGELFIEGQRAAAADNVYSYPVIDPTD